ncbi:DUF421 domain-containing protein [Natranaerofaba carboxydovora]|uniref:DUF421 domain-containing protein n=1 Tax=Natranaerofaba carboxydovora TaxID=2742683 RepID=UPI001F133A97|nr:DUF421 domain-containing protein [Natranaerofaba carboxydovora]UMZ74872.1 hypothetical protein ACONDI_02476 [Natranaerofaba carboxydovora]
MALTMLYRTVIVYIIIFTLLRIMGKREVAQLSSFDLVVAIMMAEVSVLTIEDDTMPIYVGAIPLVTLFALEILVSRITIKNRKIRAIVEGKPTILIDRGRIKEYELKSVRINLNDLTSQLRQKNVQNISEVEYAVLEPSGQLSVIKKADKRTVTKEDMNITPPRDALPVPIIMDGKIEYEHLDKFNLTEKWLQSELQKKGYSSPREIFYASLDSDGSLYISPKESYLYDYQHS